MDEGLLTGVLAVQLGMASPAQVFAAASAYVADPSRSIVDRLCSDGVLDEKRRELLASLVADALRVHGGGPRSTLESLGGGRAMLESFGGSIVVDEGGQTSVAATSDSLDGEGVSAEQSGRYRFDGGNRDAAEIGRGGIGRVLVAHDEHIGRDVAVKELLAGSARGRSGPSGALSATTAVAARFLREARVTGQLEHPNIVPVYEVGQRADGTYYYTMRLVRGRTLTDALRSCSGLRERLELLPHYVSLCNAVGYAHSRGVIHRDLKPDNVMIGAFGETVVLDWGLAKVHGKQDIRGTDMAGELRLLQDAASGHTVDGSAVGTPAYMSPEQADGQIDAIDERSDVWSLGAVLFELLIGRPPFEGVTAFEIIGKVLRDSVTPPVQIDEHVPRELSAVAQKALSREPAERYPTAGALAAEIESYMSGGRIRAYEYTTWELVRAFARRHRAATVAALVVLAVTVASAAGLAVAYRNAAWERDRAEQHEREAHSRELEAHMNLAATFGEKALRLLEERRFGPAKVLAAASLVHNPAADRGPHHDAEFASRHPLCGDVLTRAASIHYQAELSTISRPRATLEARVGSLRYLVDSARAVGMGEQGEIVFIDTEDGKPVATHPPRKDPYVGFDVSSDGALVVAVTSRGAVQAFDARTLEPAFSVDGVARDALNVRLSRDARKLAVSSRDGWTDIWDTRSGALVGSVRGSDESARDAAFVGDGGSLAVVGGDGVLRLWDVATQTLEGSREGHPSVIAAIAVSPDGSQLATAGYDGFVRVWSATNLERIADIQVQAPQLKAVTYTNDGGLLLAGGDDRSVIAFDTTSWSRVATIPTRSGSIRAVSLSADGETLALGIGGGRLQTFDLSMSSKVRILRANRNDTYRIAIDREGRRLASGHAGAAVVDIWDVETTALLATLPASGAIFDVAFSRDGERLFGTSSEARSTDVWDLGTDGHLIFQVGDAGRTVVVSHDGRVVARGGADGVELRDATTDALVRRFEGGVAVALSPDDRVLATGTRGRVALYDVASGELVGEVGGLADTASDLSFSHDGRWLALAGLGGHLLIIDVPAREVAFELKGHDLWINTVRFSPDDSMLASTSDDGTVRLWSLASRSTDLMFQGIRGGSGIEFLPDGRSLAFSNGAAVEIWPIDLSVREADPRELLHRAQDELHVELRGTELVSTD